MKQAIPLKKLMAAHDVMPTSEDDIRSVAELSEAQDQIDTAFKHCMRLTVHVCFSTTDFETMVDGYIKS